MAILDLRQDNILKIYAEKNVVYMPSFEDIPNLDVGYTITLDDGLATEKIYTVGSGLTLGTNSIIWTLDTNVLETKTYSGKLVSDSSTAGIYLCIDITLIIEAKC